MAVHAVDHPLIKHHLTRLRDITTGSSEFRRLINRLAVLLAYEATKDLTLDSHTVTTPICEMNGSKLNQRIGLVPIIRAGLGMVEPIHNLIPHAEVWHLGLYRDEATARPVEYYSRIPTSDPIDVALVVDPMLATGGSAAAALNTLKQWGVPSLKLLCVIAAPEGIETIKRESPDTQIFVCSVDEKLNEKKFIVPGLGDAGDRIFNTP